MPHSTPYRRQWQEAALAAVLLAGGAAWTFRALLLQNKAFYWGDIGLYFAPMLAFLHDNLRAGRIPLWNPQLLCGAPYVGNPQTWPLYPGSALLAALPPDRFVSVTVAAHVWLAGCGMWGFLRRAQGTTFAAALLGAVTFAFGGQLVSKSQFPNMLQSIAYVPWLLWTTNTLARQWRGRDAAALGLVLGLQLLAAHAQITLLSLYLAAGYGLFVLWAQRKDGHAVPAWAVGLLAGALVLAAGLAAGQLLPTMELARDAWRQRLSFAIVDRFYLPFNQLANGVAPTLHGHPLWGSFTGRGNFWETCCYAGIVPAALALLGAVRVPAARFWLLVWVIGTWLALGGPGGLYYVAYKLLPGFAAFHDPARCLLWAAFGLAALAAMGWDCLADAWPALRRSAALALLLAFLPLAAFDASLYPLAAVHTLRPATPLIDALRADPAFQTHQARYLAPDSARAWERFTAHQSYRQNAPNYQRLWADTLTPNLLMPYALPDAYGYEPLARRDTQALTAGAANAFAPDAPSATRAQASQQAGLLAVRDIAFLRVRDPATAFPLLTPLAHAPTLPPLRGDGATPAHVYLLRNAAYQPRARLAGTGDGRQEALTPPSEWRPSPASQARVKNKSLLAQARVGDKSLLTLARDNGNSLLTLARDNGRGWRAAPGEGLLPAGEGLHAWRAAPGEALPVPETADITTDTPDEVDITTNSPRPSRLLLADTRAPGWAVTIDGRAAPLDAYNVCLRAVLLPAGGTHHVQFVYKPTAFRVGLYVTLLSWGTLAGLCAAMLAKNTRHRTAKRQE